MPLPDVIPGGEFTAWRGIIHIPFGCRGRRPQPTPPWYFWQLLLCVEATVENFGTEWVKPRDLWVVWKRTWLSNIQIILNYMCKV